jgi:2-C-methyl-D-erythritol 2,4-cyclodiphosphate synthase
MIRTGLGYDSHRLQAGRRLVLGGVEIPGEIGLDGHSDADVLTHAVIDALLGAAGLGDIGEHFPDTAPEYRDADSIGLLREVTARVGAAGWSVVNLDATVVIERPRLGPHKEAMRGRLAEACGLEPGAVNVKATTGEAVGFVGRGEGAAALAVATVERAVGPGAPDEGR